MDPRNPISHYELAEKLGEGAMGEVYKAWDLNLQRPVALKFLRPSLCESEAQVARFEHEAHVVAALNHPNVATIHEIDRAGGRHFLAFEYLAGGTLKSALDQLRSAGQQISIEQGLDYAIQLAEALAYAHRQGVIHRDIKTANVMFAESGTLKLTDFGLAKIGEGIDFTQPGTVMGTPATMSPEQAQGQEADERSDVFSLGVVLFELFSGELPFKGANPAAVMYQVVHEAPAPLSRFRPGLPEALQEIISKAIAKHPEERYQNAAGLASDLRALRRDLLTGSSTAGGSLDTVVMTTGRAKTEGRGWWPRCSRRTLATGAGTLSLIAAILLGVWLRPVPETRLAILRFQAGEDKSAQTTLDGFRDLLNAELTSVERPRGSGIALLAIEDGKDQQIASPSDARSRLGADLVLAGKLVQAGEQPHLIVSLYDPARSEELRSIGIDIARDNLPAAATKLLNMLELGTRARLRLAFLSHTSSNTEAARLYVEGRGSLNNGKFEEAEAAFRDAVKRDPNFAFAWAGLADALRLKYRFERNGAVLDEAAQSAARALENSKKRDAGIHITMAEILLDQKMPQAAEPELRAAIALEPANGRAYQALGKLYFEQGDYQKAEATYRQAIEMRPGDAAAYNRLGNFYYQRRLPQLLPDAARAFLEATDRAPDNFVAHSNLGAVYLKMERYNDAIQEFKKSISIAPSVLGYGNLGTAYYYAGYYDDAVEAYRKTIEQSGENFKNWGNLADAYRWAGHEDEASGSYRKAIELLKKDNQIDTALRHATLAMYYVSIRHNGSLTSQDRQAAEAEIAAARLPASPPQSSIESAILFREVIVYAQLEKLDKAFPALEKLRDTAPATLDELKKTPALRQFRKDPRFFDVTTRTNKDIK
ncbi:MAG: protein kinase [Bryobacterales bacterium]|nr:protein kinase [Bryobacterales bacterium]MBV9400478.1 protein kinase [Bryobacterales bacterium]